MSLLDSVKALFSPSPPSVAPLRQADGPAAPVLDALRGVIDPELGVDIVSLGLVRGIELDQDLARVRMVLTTPGCPVAHLLVEQIAQEVGLLGYQAEVVVEEDPPWRPEDMDEEAREVLG